MPRYILNFSKIRTISRMHELDVTILKNTSSRLSDKDDDTKSFIRFWLNLDIKRYFP